MTVFQPRDPDFELRVRSSFARQPHMSHIGACLCRVIPGEVDITMPSAEHILQQHGYVHGGALASIADSAAGFAAMSLAAINTNVLTAELKVNFLRPASGKKMIARGRILKPGKTLTICQTDVFGISDNLDKKETHVLTGLVTIMHIDDLSD